jgi:hypothetical protein
MSQQQHEELLREVRVTLREGFQQQQKDLHSILNTWSETLAAKISQVS